MPQVIAEVEGATEYAVNFGALGADGRSRRAGGQNVVGFAVPGREMGAPWGRTLLGIALAYAGFLGFIQVIAFSGPYTGGR